MKTPIEQMATVAALTALAFVGSVHAHHSQSMFDISTPIWVRGIVIRYEPISPHAMIELEEKAADGRVQRWAVEGPFPGRLQRILDSNKMSPEHHLVEVGDVIQVCGFDLREEFQARGVEPHAATTKFMHAQVIVMPDGHMQSWGPYGKLENCVRPTDNARAWGDFLNRDALARDLWCSGRANTKAASVAPRPLVDEIDRSLAHRCE